MDGMTPPLKSSPEKKRSAWELFVTILHIPIYVIMCAIIIMVVICLVPVGIIGAGLSWLWLVADGRKVFP